MSQAQEWLCLLNLPSLELAVSPVDSQAGPVPLRSSEVPSSLFPVILPVLGRLTFHS